MASVRPTDDPNEEGFWKGSGQSILFDAALNEGAGGFIVYNDLLRISKGAELIEAEECDCKALVTLDLTADAATFQYFPSHPLDVVFVLDVTSSMLSGSSTKFVQAKRAIISTINRLWESNRDTTVTIVPYGRAAFFPNEGSPGFSYNYLGTLFSWKRSSSFPGHYIGQILGYRNQSFVGTTDLAAFEAQSVPLAASAELSLYNSYNYYKIRYGDIYDNTGNPLPDTVLSTYITTIFNPALPTYASNVLISVAQGVPLTPTQLEYSMNDGNYLNNTILDNLVWAIPYSEDTNAEAGLLAAYTLFKTPGFAQSNDIFRRATILITDGQANRSINPEYPDSLAAPGDTDADFLPDTPGEAWKYFIQLQQTLPTLVAEISNRSSTFEEIMLASTRTTDIAALLKDPADGNTSVYTLGIDISAQTPGPYTRENVIEFLQTWASAPSFFRNADSSDPGAIAILLEQLVQDLFQLSGGSLITLHDQINTALFTYIPGTISIRGSRNGLLLKSPNQPVIIDPADPDFTVYPKEPLLPDVSDASVSASGAVTVDFGILPLGLLAADSDTLITLSYQLQSTPFASGDELHTNIDEQTFATFVPPNHLLAQSSVLDYSADPLDVFFPSATVPCHCAPFPALSIRKYADRNSVAPGDQVNYTIQITNTGTLVLSNTVVNDPLLGIQITIAVLEPLESFIFTQPFTIPGGTPAGPFPNTVTAVNTALADPLSATAIVMITTLPALIFLKSVDKRLAAPGETVIFTLTGINDGPIDLINVRVVDTLLGIDVTIDRIAVGATITADFPYRIPFTAQIGSKIVNVATATADQVPPITVAATVEVASVPMLSLTKQSDRAQSVPGETITFTILVSNTGLLPLTGVVVADPTLGLNTTIAQLAPGETVPLTVLFRVPLETPPAAYTNTATAISDQTPNPVEDSAVVVILPAPALGIAKTPDRSVVSPGETISYEILLVNLGNIALGPFRVTDTLLGVDFVSPGLAIGESTTVGVTYPVPDDALSGSLISNLVVAESPEAGTVQAEAVVLVAGAGLRLTKTPDRPIAMPGEVVVYQLSVTNLLNVAQTNIVLRDDVLGFSEVIPLLAAGETAVRDIPHPVGNLPDGTVIVNVSSVSSDQSPLQSAEAQVIVYQMLGGTELRVRKVPSGTIATPGSTIIYSVTVSNVGAAAATDIVVIDTLTGTRLSIPALASGAEQVVTFPYIVPVDTPLGAVVYNRVLVTSPQANPVQDEAEVSIGLPRFLLSLTNVVDRPVAEPGSLVHFTVTVKNISPYTLTDVHVFEDLTGFGTLLASLSPGESRAFSLPFRIPAASVGGESFVSTATAFSNETPFQQATAATTTFRNADFTIAETVDRPVVFGGETVHFTIVTHNIGNVDLINFRFEAPLLALIFTTDRFLIGAEITITAPFVTPHTSVELIIPSPVSGRADNAPTKFARAAVKVIPDDEE